MRDAGNPIGKFIARFLLLNPILGLSRTKTQGAGLDEFLRVQSLEHDGHQSVTPDLHLLNDYGHVSRSGLRRSGPNLVVDITYCVGTPEGEGWARFWAKQWAKEWEESKWAKEFRWAKWAKEWAHSLAQENKFGQSDH